MQRLRVTAIEQIGDREGHALSSVQYTCSGVEGLLKGAVYTFHERERKGRKPKNILVRWRYP